MLNLSKSERHFILTMLFLGLLCAGLSYYKKRIRPVEFTTISISDKVTLIDINTADALQLETLHGIGPVLAKAIIDFREKAGRFEKLEDLQHVTGIGSKKFEQIKGLIKVE